MIKNILKDFIGEKNVELLNDKYNDEGVEVYRLGKVIKNVITESNVDTSKIGSYLVNYVVNDRVIKKRHVNVVDNVRPVIELLGDKIVTLEIGQEYLEDGYIVSDNIDKDIDKRRGPGAVVCRCEYKLKLRKNLFALPIEYI